jgi:hypothetical protein
MAWRHQPETLLVARRKEPSIEPKEKTRGYVLTSAGTLIIVLFVCWAC